MDRLLPDRSLLLVVDVQERLAVAMPEGAMAQLLKNTALLLDAAKVLGVPVVCSEQYPKGLGPTVPPLAEKLRDLGVTPLEKLAFGAADDPKVARAVADRAPGAVIVAGMETHVCVFQTVRDLAHAGYAVHVVGDAVCSRREAHVSMGLELCERAGAYVAPAETVVFDWLRKAGSDEFKALSRLMR
jgi:nicotinamidase-related amidase